MPAGWFFSEGGTNGNTTYTAGTGSSATGDTYSFGATGSTDRALGTLRSGTLLPNMGACFVNNTGAAITSLAIAYARKNGVWAPPDERTVWTSNTA